MLTKYMKTKLTVRTLLKENLPGGVIGRTSDNDSVLLKWSPRTFVLKPSGFFSMVLWAKTNLYHPPLATSLEKTKTENH